MYDLLIIGKGPAGISASLYGARAGLRTLIVAKGFGALEKAEKIDNYFGFAEPVTGMQLLRNGHDHAKRLGVGFVDTEVTSVVKEEHFTVHTTAGVFESLTVVIATGMPRKKPSIPGIEAYEGAGVSYCAVCDGFFYRGKSVGVVGSGDYALSEAAELLPFASSITIYTNGRPMESTQDVSHFSLDLRRIVGLEGEGRLERLLFEDGTSASLNGLFVAEGSASSLDLAIKLGLETEGKAIKVDRAQHTSLEGLFAAGDCTGGVLQISLAVGEGATAGLAAIEHIRKQKKAAGDAPASH